jgi:hypothetical protein
MDRILWMVLAAVCVGIYTFFNSPLPLPTDGLRAEGPRDIPISNAGPIDHKEYRLSPQVLYTIEGRIIFHKRYRLFRDSEVAPFDLFLGWGPMSDPAIYSKVSIKHGRTYWITPPADGSLTEDQIWHNHSNNHVIPANEQVFDALSRLHEGMIVKLRGSLVNVSGSDGFVWSSSLSRTDRGFGNCELFYVESVEVVSDGKAAVSG